jgi:enamine deaminase RidA (YjgF/YER057c/UK114 family)
MQAVVKKMLNPGDWKKPRGYTHLVKVEAGSVLYVAGQAAFDAAGKIVGVGDFCRQYEQTLANISHVLELGGAALNDVVRMTIYCTNRDYFIEHGKQCAQIYKQYFGEYYPAITMVEVSRLFHDDMLIEVEVQACV